MMLNKEKPYAGLQEEITFEIQKQFRKFVVKNSEKAAKKFSKRVIKTKYLKDNGYMIRYSNGNMIGRKNEEERNLLKKRKKQFKLLQLQEENA